jgi:hypothetical protein
LILSSKNRGFFELEVTVTFFSICRLTAVQTPYGDSSGLKLLFQHENFTGPTPLSIFFKYALPGAFIWRVVAFIYAGFGLAFFESTPRGAHVWLKPASFLLHAVKFTGAGTFRIFDLHPSGAVCCSPSGLHPAVIRHFDSKKGDCHLFPPSYEGGFSLLPIRVRHFAVRIHGDKPVVSIGDAVPKA